MLFCSKSSCCQLTVYVQILLSELGFDRGFLDHLREDYLTPLASLLYPEWVGPSGLDSHRAFSVSYQLEGDTQLSYHFDNAEVTLNVCLGTSFTGGELSFGPMAGVSTGELTTLHAEILGVRLTIKMKTIHFQVLPLTLGAELHIRNEVKYILD